MAQDADFDADIDKMTRIAQVLKEFDSPDVQALAYATLAARAFGTPLPTREPVIPGVDPAAVGEVVDLDADTRSRPSTKKTPAQKAPARKAPGKKTGKKPTYDVPKGVNYAPSGKQSLKEFAEAKQPNNNWEKALVVCYWLQKIAERTVNTGEVIAAFNFLGWRNPADPGNNLQQVAAKKGWLDTKDMSNIDVVWAGEHYLQHDLPVPAKPDK